MSELGADFVTIRGRLRVGRGRLRRGRFLWGPISPDTVANQDCSAPYVGADFTEYQWQRMYDVTQRSRVRLESSKTVCLRPSAEADGNNRLGLLRDNNVSCHLSSDECMVVRISNIKLVGTKRLSHGFYPRVTDVMSQTSDIRASE